MGLLNKIRGLCGYQSKADTGTTLFSESTSIEIPPYNRPSKTITVDGKGYKVGSKFKTPSYTYTITRIYAQGSLEDIYVQVKRPDFKYSFGYDKIFDVYIDDFRTHFKSGLFNHYNGIKPTKMLLKHKFI
jgi:hypothetical protein